MVVAKDEKAPISGGAPMAADMSEYDEKSPETYFLRTIRQMENAAVLIRRLPDGTTETVFVSQRFAKLMECEAEDAMRLLRGKGLLETTHPDDRLSVKRMLRRRISDQGTKELTIRKLTAEGNTIWCRVHYAFIDDFGKHYIYCTYFDVTKAHVYAQRLRSMYMAIGDQFYQENERTLGLFRVNLTQDRIEDMRGKDLFGTDSAIRPYSEVTGLRAENYPILEERERFLATFSTDALIASYLKGSSKLSDYFFSRRKDGSYCYVNCVAVLTRHPVSEEIIAFISELEANKQKVESVLLDKILARRFDMVAYLANGRYGVVVGDAALIGKGSIFPLSKRGDYEEYLSGQVFPVLHGDRKKKEAMHEALQLSTIKRELRQKEPYIVNIVCDIDGGLYHKRLDFYTVDPKAEFYILLKSDNTEIQRKQIEQNNRLRAALEEARQASVAKTAFLSRMSHEIRTPMNAIIGLDNIALHEEGLSDTLREHLEKIGSSARYLLSLINDILDMSRIESGRMTLRNEEFSFRSFVDQIHMIADSQCRDRGLRFRCTMAGRIEEYYIGDDTKLKQVLINILGNAVKFTEPGGDVELAIECTAQYEGQSNFRFIVRDTGIGMDKEYLPRLFEPFSQEDATTTSKYGGSGLGLAITKNIVEMMNGSIAADSEKGKGSSFIVTMPLKNSARRQEIREDGLELQDLSVLVIDDDPVAADYAKTVLGEAGISADSCDSGAEALKMIRLQHARRREYNLILVDLKMPEQDGIDVTREIRKLLDENTTVIILTVYDWLEVEQEATEAGVDGFLSKPLIASNMLHEVRQTLRRKRQQTEDVPLANLEGRRILVAEDMAVNAEIVRQLLTMGGMEAEHAENGKLAVEMVASHPAGYYDAVLMDVRMPVMDGLQATEAIRSLDHPDSRMLPIIAMTANAFDEDVQRSLQAGMNAHLAKPVEPEHMYRTLRELIGKKLASSSQKSGGKIER